MKIATVPVARLGAEGVSGGSAPRVRRLSADEIAERRARRPMCRVIPSGAMLRAHKLPRPPDPPGPPFRPRFPAPTRPAPQRNIGAAGAAPHVPRDGQNKYVRPKVGEAYKPYLPQSWLHGGGERCDRSGQIP